MILDSLTLMVAVGLPWTSTSGESSASNVIVFPPPTSTTILREHI